MYTLEKSEKNKYINMNKMAAIGEAERAIFEILRDKYDNYDEIIFLCIGTDRATGDCLGPMVGYKLSRMILKEKVYVYGTIDEPVHAKNLEEIIEEIRNAFLNPFIIAIDASLGNPEMIDCIKIGEGGLRPGAGVKKILPEVGNAHITGIVNSSGFMEFMVLQNTRLATVMKMADIIVGGIVLCLRRF